MDIFINPIFSRESNIRESNNPNRPSYPPAEKMTFQPTIEEKFTFNPLADPKQSNKQPSGNPYKYESNQQNYPPDQILIDMSMNSSSMNNTSMISVDQSKVEKNFFKNPLYLNNSIQKKPLYFEQDGRIDTYPAYQDFTYSAGKKPEDYTKSYQEKDKNIDFKMLDFNANSVDLSKNNSRISIPQFTNPEYDQDLKPNLKDSSANIPTTKTINPGSILNKLDSKSQNYNKYETFNKQNGYFESPKNSKFEDKDIFKKTAEFKDLGFNSSVERGTFGTNNLNNMKPFLPEIPEKRTSFDYNNNSPSLMKSYDVDEKSVLLDVSQLKDKVISALSKFKEQLTNPEKNDRKKNLEREYLEINKEFSTIVDKYSNLSVSQMVESGFAGVSANMSYLKTGGPNENEINNMMELVQEFLEKFQPKNVTQMGRETTKKTTENLLKNDNSSNNGKILKESDIGFEGSTYTFENRNKKSIKGPEVLKNEKSLKNSDVGESSYQYEKNEKSSKNNNNNFNAMNSYKYESKNDRPSYQYENKTDRPSYQYDHKDDRTSYQSYQYEKKTYPSEAKLQKFTKTAEFLNQPSENKVEKILKSSDFMSPGAAFQFHNINNKDPQAKTEQYLKTSDNIYPNTYQEEIKSFEIPKKSSYQEDIKSFEIPKKSIYQEDIKSFEIPQKSFENPVKHPKKLIENPLDKIEEIKRQRKNEELEQSFLTIKNNITAYDLDHTKNYGDMSYLSEISILTPNDKSPKNYNKPNVYRKKSIKINLFGFHPKITRFYKTKDDLTLNKAEMNEFELICEKCEGVFRGYHWQKHRENCMNYRKTWIEDDNMKVDLRVNEEKILLTLNRLVQRISQNKSFSEKDLEAKLLYNIKMCLSQNLKDHLNNVMRSLSELIEFLTKSNLLTSCLGFLVIANRLDKLINELLQAKKITVLIEKNSWVFDDVDSDIEENKKKKKIQQNQIDQPKIVNEKIENVGSFKKKKEEKNNEEEIKNYFFTEAVNLKFSLPLNHPKRRMMISDLYEEAKEKMVKVEDFRRFIENKLS